MRNKLLGAIIAGGAARRFGGDKGAALLHGRALIDHVASALAPQVDHLVIVGRYWPELESLADIPAPHIGPLGGLAAALVHAESHGFTDVLTAGCDTLPIPADYARLMPDGPAVIAGHYLIGRWPARLSTALLAHLASTDDRSMRGWMVSADAKHIAQPYGFHNLNTPADVAAYAFSSSSAAQS